VKASTTSTREAAKAAPTAGATVLQMIDSIMRLSIR
jgi:hypothetical protein